MSFFPEWADELIGIGNKVCDASGLAWKDTPWRTVANSFSLSEADLGYLKGFLAEKLDNKNERVKNITARAKALVAEEEVPFG
jgi:hypothetical protein